MADSEFPRTIRRWISSTEGEPDEDDFETLHAMLEASGWLPPQDLNVSLERPIRKLEKRKQHHVEMARMDDDYADHHAGDRIERDESLASADKHRRQAEEYAAAEVVLRKVQEAQRV